MADVRSMLRAERANRRITHPNASYTTDGKLLCNLCETTIKSEAAWGAHLHSTQHALRLNRANDVANTRGAILISAQTPANKKRKASDFSSPADEEKKRVRWAEDEVQQAPEGGKRLRTASPDKEINIPITVTKDPLEEPKGDAGVDDDEFAAFERDIAAIGEEAAQRPAYSAGAIISAAPVTTEEILAKEEEERKDTRGRRDVEIEEEREDAARLLQDEFDEMEGLEDRVRKLREKREALRGGGLKRVRTMSVDMPVRDAVATKDRPGDTVPEKNTETENPDEEEEEDEDDDSFDDWTFGISR